MKLNITRSAVRHLLLGLTLGCVVTATQQARAGAFAVDSRNGNYTYAHAEARDGTPQQQYNLAIKRAIYWGASLPYIRCAQFNVPKGTRVQCSVGYVPGKGWCGNWAINGANSADGLIRQGAVRSSIFLAFSWVE
jgi:hypothetical protein